MRFLAIILTLGSLFLVSRPAEARFFASKRQAIIKQIYSLRNQGYHYSNRGRGPKGFDCSHFVHFVMTSLFNPAHFNIHYMPSRDFRNFLKQQKAQIPCSRARVADFIYFDSSSPGRSSNHIGFVLDPQAATFISALSTDDDIKESYYGPKAYRGHRNPECYENRWAD